MKRNRTVQCGLGCVLLLGLLLLQVPGVQAISQFAYSNEAFESERFTWAGDGTFSLTYLGVGGGNCDSNDRRFRVNVNRSYRGSDWKYYSNNSYYMRTPSGRPIYGFQLNTVNAHICIGRSEFQWWIYPRSYWTENGVTQNIYTWRR